MKLSDIKPNPDNPRVLRDDRFQKLKKSIQEFPKMLSLRPMVIDNQNHVLGGNMRLRALQDLGYKEIPDDWVRRADDLTDDEKKRFIIVDNVSFGEWDFDELANNWDLNNLSDWGLDIPNFEQESEKQGTASDDNYEIPNEINISVKNGDLIKIGDHLLICGDCRDSDVLKKMMGDDLATLIVTDPPYNVDYTGGTKDALKIENDKKNDNDFYHFLIESFNCMYLFSAPGAVWDIWHGDQEGFNFRAAMKEAGIKIRQCLIWVKNTLVMGQQDYHWKHESCLYGWKEGAAHKWNSDRKQTTVLEFDRPQRNSEHPTMKPVELIAYQIGNNSDKGDIVLDTFAGSGTTMVACHQLNRQARCVELDPKYCQVIIDRMQKLDSAIDIKINGQPYLNPEKIA